jgi:WD40 repeat protein
MRSRALLGTAAPWRYAHWLGLCLLVAACAPAPAVSSVTPTASSPMQRATITAYHGHTSTVFTVEWSPDGRRIASGDNDSTVQVGDTMTGHHLLTYRGQSAPVRGVAWSPDGTHIASASQDGMVQVWDDATGHHLFTYSGHTAPVWAVAWSPSGKCIVSASGNISDERPKETVQVWNAMTGLLISSYPVASNTTYADGTLSVAWAPDSTHIALGGGDTVVHLWSLSECRT